MSKVFGKEGYPSKSGVGFTTINKPADHRKLVTEMGSGYWREGQLEAPSSVAVSPKGKDKPLAQPRDGYSLWR
jgi:hypothetical protein